MFSQESALLLTKFHSEVSTSSSVYIPPPSKVLGVNLSTRFNMGITNIVECRLCKSVSSLNESINGMIQLDLTPRVKLSVENMLSAYFSKERLIDSACSSCQSKKERFKYCNATLIPSELILHFKRFSYNAAYNLSTKNETAVSFPGVLNIADCLSFPNASTTAEVNVNASTINMYPRNCNSGLFDSLPTSFSTPAHFYNGMDDLLSFPKRKLLYQLTGVVRHEGGKYSRLDKGHFVADTLDKTIGGKSQWKRLDDQMCKDTTLVIVIIISTICFYQSNCFSFVLI